MVDAWCIWLYFLLADPAGAVEAGEGSCSISITLCFTNSLTESFTDSFAKSLTGSVTCGRYQGDYHLREGQVREESDGFETEVPERV